MDAEDLRYNSFVFVPSCWPEPNPDRVAFPWTWWCLLVTAAGVGLGLQCMCVCTQHIPGGPLVKSKVQAADCFFSSVTEGFFYVFYLAIYFFFSKMRENNFICKKSKGVKQKSWLTPSFLCCSTIKFPQSKN